MVLKKKENLLASIVIPFYNDEKTVEKVVNSVLNQDYKNMEIILINDMSKDETLNKINKFSKNKFVKIINNEKNLGLVKSLNKGIKKSRGEIIVTLLGDCYPLNNFWLKELLKPFKDSRIVASTARVRYPSWLWERFDPLTREITKKWVGDFLSGLDQKGVAYRKDSLLKVGFFDESTFKNFGEDFDMTFKLKKIGKTFHGTKGIIIHEDHYDVKRVIKISESYGRAFGLLFRIYGFSLPQLKGGLLRAFFPFWAIGKFHRDHRNAKNKPTVFLISLKMNWVYTVNFLKGYLKIKD
ncbi:MAG: glycosyltransferase family 2 protein [Patescibacteria group bacterium]|nr:glycosyltransferase family 2 protein [Patescibacteria group bacterium]